MTPEAVSSLVIVKFSVVAPVIVVEVVFSVEAISILYEPLTPSGTVPSPWVRTPSVINVECRNPDPPPPAPSAQHPL